VIGNSHSAFLVILNLLHCQVPKIVQFTKREDVTLAEDRPEGFDDGQLLICCYFGMVGWIKFDGTGLKGIVKEEVEKVSSSYSFISISQLLIRVFSPSPPSKGLCWRREGVRRRSGGSWKGMGLSLVLQLGGFLTILFLLFCSRMDLKYQTFTSSSSH